PVTMVLDMHDTGAMASLLICTAFYRGLAAAILELSRQLGSEKWGNTVLQVIGDFARSARSSGSGSDHGFNQMVTSVYSGAITNGPYVVGNILQEVAGGGGGYGGSQGVGASIDGYNQKGMPTPTAAASTVAALLNLPKNPYENIAAPLAKLEGGQLKVMFPGKVKT
ncbi:MAG: twin-arginine translocation signal domain-containing protein, partial [Bdellovibrionales bacterium]